METAQALDSFAALSHEGRLAVLRLLIAAEPEGMAAGDIAARLKVLPNTLSNNLGVLSQARLVRSRRQGRQVVYFARIDTVQDIVRFLMRDCCGGAAAICGPVAADLIACTQHDNPKECRDG
ncbi:MAG: metalloregulator ArsR/SmtB family transcription factor [Paracoccus sp. (in: a-proteobacteria)]|nr:metalloregulator ArsR/SmtB family transcription factor [Paracoccus sp. (in: a-proteobacteria)]